MKKYYAKKSHKGLVGGIIISVLLLGLVGGLAYLSKGFTNWDYKNWFVKNSEEVVDEPTEEIVNKVTIDFSGNTIKDTQQIDETKILTTLQTSCDTDDIFTSVTEKSYVYREKEPTPSIRLGGASSNGTFTAVLNDEFKFNTAIIYGRSYAKTTTAPFTYDEGGIAVNSSDIQYYDNFEDTDELADITAKQFTFETLQTSLKLTSVKRINISKIILCTNLSLIEDVTE